MISLQQIFTDFKQVDKKELLLHSFVNGSYGVFNGLAIAAVSMGSPLLILGVYYILKRVEGKILNREKYKTKFGKEFVYPIPNTVGFLLGWWLSTIISKYFLQN